MHRPWTYTTYVFYGTYNVQLLRLVLTDSNNVRFAQFTPTIIYCMMCPCCLFISNSDWLTQDWAAAGNIHELAMQWHTPSELELDLVDRLLVEFMLPELQRLQAFIDGDSLDRCVPPVRLTGWYWYHSL